jgi:hypothetical protein
MPNTNAPSVTRWGYIENLKVLLVVIFLMILVAVYQPMWLQTYKFSGDGTIRTCSSLVGGGYAIKFAEFDPASPYSASYRLSHVPEIGLSRKEHEPTLYFRFQWAGPYLQWRERQKTLTGQIRVVLLDSGDQNMKSEEVSLAEMFWTQTQGLYGGYDLARTRLHLEPGRSYTLRVAYVPGTVPPPATHAYFEIDNCAYK